MPSYVVTILMWVVVLAVFYLLLILPEQRKAKKFRTMIDSLKVGNEIVTQSGIFGKIVNLKDEYMIIESGAEKTRLKMKKSSVSQILEDKSLE